MGNLGITSSGYRNINLLSTYDVKLWFDTNDTSKFTTYQSPSYGFMTYGIDPMSASTTGTINGYTVWKSTNPLTYDDYFYVYKVSPNTSWTGAGEATLVFAIESLDSSSGLSILGLGAPEYNAIVTINVSGTHYLAVITSNSSGGGGYIRRTSKTLDTNPHVVTLRVNGSDTSLYVDGSQASWADSGYNTSGSTVNWSTGMAANLFDNSYCQIFEEATWDSYFPTYPSPGGDFIQPASGAWFRHFGMTGLLTDSQRSDLHQQLRFW